MQLPNTHLPDEATTWEIWHDDTFDRDMPNTLDASGVGIGAGLFMLWQKVLHEGVLEDGRRTFSTFSLIWEKNTPNSGFAEIPMPFTDSMKHLFAQLRYWAFPLYQSHEKLPDDLRRDGCPTSPHKQNDDLLRALAALHLSLIHKKAEIEAEKAPKDNPAAQVLALVAPVDDWREITPELGQ